MNKQSIIITGLMIALIGLLGLFSYQNTKTIEAIKLANSVSDTLEIERNEKNQEKASITILQAEKQADFLKLKAKDSIIAWLQLAVKEYKGALNTAIVLKNESESKGNTKTQVIRDTVVVGGQKQVAQFYETKWTNKWEEGYILAKPDSIYRNIKVKNDYQITLGSVKNGWFKPKEYEVQVLNLNPNTSTKELRSFQVKTYPKRLSIGIQAGYGVGLIDFKPQPFIGIGFQYNLIGIK